MAAPGCLDFPVEQHEAWRWRGGDPATDPDNTDHDGLERTSEDTLNSRTRAFNLLLDEAGDEDPLAVLLGHAMGAAAMLDDTIQKREPSKPIDVFAKRDVHRHPVDSFEAANVHVSIREATETPSSGSSLITSSPLLSRIMDSRIGRAKAHETIGLASKRAAQHIDPLGLTIQAARKGLEESLFTSEDLVELFLDRIHRLNDEFRAVISACPAGIALAIAKQRDDQRRTGEVMGPLHGIPIVVKDNIATDEELGMATTAGSYALVGMPVKGDAFVVERLRDAGAIIIGKANMSELNDAKSSAASAGWSAVGGQTVSAFGPHVEVGTSSSGSGVAVAAGFCLAAVGTETDGSITLPCLYSGLYGLKPTVGLISRTGVVPYTHHMDSPGPMGRSAWDVAVMMDAMVGCDGEDTKSFEDVGQSFTDAVDNASFAGLRIGIPREAFFHKDPWGQPSRDALPTEVLSAISAALRTMQSAGAEITDPADLPCVLDGSFKAAQPDRSLVITAEYKEYLGRYLRGLGGEGGCRTAEDVIEFNEVNAALEMPLGHFGQDVLKRTQHAVSVDSPEYNIAKARMIEVAGANGIDAVMDKHGLDALMMFRRGAHAPANMVGYPIATVPIGIDDEGRPFGAFFIGRAHSERKLLSIMSAWEKIMPGRPIAQGASLV